MSIGDLTQGDLIISEIMVNADEVSDSNGEWFEVFVSNSLTGTLQLNGLVFSNISSGSTQTEVLNANILVSAGDRVVFVRNLNASENGGLTGDGSFSFSLNNSGEIVGLWKEEALNNVIDSVDVDNEGSVVAGASLALDEKNVWCTGVSTYGDGDKGTPGAQNDSCEEYNEDCGDSIDNDGDGSTDCSDDDCDDAGLCFDSSDVISLLSSATYSCNDCHGSSGGFGLSDLEPTSGNQSSYVDTSNALNSLLIQK